jgi:hypothetical protein
MDSILTTIKQMLGGLTEQNSHFDTEIITHINTALFRLHQLGVGPDKRAHIEDSSDTWNSVFGDMDDIQAVKDFIYFKVKLVFDPPTSSFVLESIKEQINELEWCLCNDKTNETQEVNE